jgi:hypothetical protein
MLAKLFFTYLLATTLGIGVDEGWGTIYGFPGDEWAGGPLACDGKPIPQDEPVCAHRWLPCGTQVAVFNLERPGVTTCRVGDRGPYGADGQNRWKGVIDMTPFVAKGANLDGKDFVRLLYRLPAPESKTYESMLWLNPPRRSGPTM